MIRLPKRPTPLRTAMAAVRVSMSWLGTRKTLTAEQKQEAAEPFGADAKFLSAGKRLLDTAHPAYKAVTAVRSQVITYWKWMSLPYPEPGNVTGLEGTDSRFIPILNPCRRVIAENGYYERRLHPRWIHEAQER